MSDLPKEDQEFIDKAVGGEETLPEAPVSITVKGYYKGFSVLITKRNATGKVELEKIMEAIDNMVEKGFNPSWNDETNEKVKPTQPVEKDDLTSICPIHGVEMEQKQGKYGPYWTHSKFEDEVWFNCNGRGWRENVKS